MHPALALPHSVCLSLILGLGLLPTAATAQQTLVVNAAGGTPYQAIQPAIDAAAPGDIIEVRPGNYPPFLCGKAIRIQGAAGVVVQEVQGSTIDITGIPAGQTMALSQVALQQDANSISEAYLVVRDCQGLVLLDRILPGPNSLEPQLSVTRVAGLLVSNSTIGPVRLTDTTASLTNCSIQSASLDLGTIVRLQRSTLDLTDGNVRIRLSLGGTGFGLTDSTLRVRFVHGLTITTVQMGRPVVEFDIGANSRVIYHSYVMPPNPTVLGGPFYRTFDMTSLRATPAGPSGTISIELVNVVGRDSVFLFAGGPVVAYAVAGIDGPLFVGGPFLVTLGVFPLSQGLVTVPVNVPADPALRGLPLVAQGVTTAFATTNADGFTLR